MTDQPLVPESAEVRRERARRLRHRVRRELSASEAWHSEPAASARTPETAVLRWLLLMPDELLDADVEDVGRRLRAVMLEARDGLSRPEDLLEWWERMLPAWMDGRKS